MDYVERTVTFSVRLSRAERQLVANVAKAEHMSEADWLRVMIKDRAAKLGLLEWRLTSAPERGSTH